MSDFFFLLPRSLGLDGIGADEVMSVVSFSCWRSLGLAGMAVTCGADEVTSVTSFSCCRCLGLDGSVGLSVPVAR